MAALVSLAGILTEQEEAFCMDIAMGVRYVDAVSYTHLTLPTTERV